MKIIFQEGEVGRSLSGHMLKIQGSISLINDTNDDKVDHTHAHVCV